MRKLSKSKVHRETQFFTAHDRIPEREKAVSAFGDHFADLAQFYGFEKIATPGVEDAKPFMPLARARLFDERAPIVWKTRTGQEVILRVAGVLSALRAYAGHKMNDWPHPLKFSFRGESFFVRGDRANQAESVEECGMVVIGEEGPIAEAEVMHVIWRTLEEMGVPSAELELVVNATGCGQCRPHFRSSFLSYFRPRAARLCRTCKRHLKRAPTAVLRCEEEKCKIIARRAPQLLDFLCEPCKKHLRGILEFLDETNIPYFLDARLFREGSWFQHFIFEIRRDLSAGAVEPDSELKQEQASMIQKHHGALASRLEGEHKPVVAEGGRISGAGELIVGKWIDAVCGVLFASGFAFAHAESGMRSAETEQEKVFLAQLGELAKRKSLVLMEVLRHGGIKVIESLGRDSVKSQLNVAQKAGAKIALILGQKEALDETVIVREVDSGMQETVPQEKLIPFLRRRLEKGSVHIEPFK